jgi:hypothetical protein
MDIGSLDGMDIGCLDGMPIGRMDGMGERMNSIMDIVLK